MEKSAAVSAAVLGAVFLAAAAPMVFAQTAAPGSQAKADHPVQIELTSKLESRSAAVGALVAAKLLEPVVLGGNTISKGAKLTGKVTAATPGQSIAFAFDMIEAKGKAPEAIHADVLSVAPKTSLSDAGPSGHDLPMSGTASQQAAQGGMGQNERSGELPDLPLGSTIKGVTLAPSSDAMTATLTSGKDFKIDSGARMEVGLWTGAAK